MQSIAQGLLVLQLTGSGTALGFVAALQALPVLLLGPWCGVIADRLPKRPILYATQSVSCLLALVLGLLVATGEIRLWMVNVLALLLGMVKAIDTPTRQTFVLEMVGREELTNAISLNSTAINVARVLGPSLAGGLVALVGLAGCFVVNGLTYLVVLSMLVRMRGEDLMPTPRVARAKGQLAEGFRYVRSSPIILSTLVMMALIGTFTYEFSVVLPLFAAFTFGNAVSGYAAMTAAMGAGAIVGGLFAAGRRTNAPERLVLAALMFGVTVLITSLMPTLPAALLGLVAVGFFSISFTALGNVTLQLNSSPEMRGRVMALWSVAFLGSTPIGGPIVGWIGEHAGARVALALGGIAAIVAAGIGMMALRHGASRHLTGDADGPSTAAVLPPP